MATAASEAMAKGGMRIGSNVLRESAPELRTPEALYRKLEQIFDAGQRGELGPKQFEQLVTTLKMMIRLGFDIPRGYLSLLMKHKSNEAKIIEVMNGMKAPMLKALLGLPTVAGTPIRAELTTRPDMRRCEVGGADPV